MKKWFRWQGIIIFVFVIAVIFLTWYILADFLLKQTIEKYGSRAVGAKVEVAKADFHLFPLGITLDGLQITNPERPMFNAVETGTIDFSLDGGNLLRRKIIIDNMAVENVRINTPRKTSGAQSPVTQETASLDKYPGSSNSASLMPSFQLPDVKDILAREKLDSLEQIKNLRMEIEAAEASWKKRLSNAPDQRTFEQYQARVKKIQKNAKGITGVLTATKDLNRLKKDITNDLDKLKAIQDDFRSDQKAFKAKLAQVKSAPQKDIDRILNTYTLSADGLGNMSKLLFGEKIGTSIQKGLYWYGRIKPYLEKTGSGASSTDMEKHERGKGINVRFKEEKPLPDFLVKQILVSLIIPAGELEGEIRHVTPEQDILGKPLEFSFAGETLKGLQSILIKGNLDHIDPLNAKDEITASLTQYRIQNLQLSASDTMPVTLKKGLADLNSRILLHDDMLDAKLQIDSKDVEIVTEGKEDSNAIQNAIELALAEVSNFSVTTNAQGPFDKYHVKITSDLDHVLKKAVSGQIANLRSKFQNSLQTGIMEKIKNPLANTSERMTGLDNISKEITSRLNLGKEISKLNLKL